MDDPMMRWLAGKLRRPLSAMCSAREKGKKNTASTDRVKSVLAVFINQLGHLGAGISPSGLPFENLNRLTLSRRTNLKDILTRWLAQLHCLRLSQLD
jgi:hypothetical protein